MNLETTLTMILCFQVFQAIYIVILHHEIRKLNDKEEKK